MCKSKNTAFISVATKVTFFFFMAISLPSILHSQIIVNGGFENSTTGWEARGESTLKLLPQAYEGGRACKVKNRKEYWNGVSQSLLGNVEEGKDYHLTCYVKLVGVTNRQVRFEIKLEDDLGVQYAQIGHVLATDSEWTLLETGFQFQPTGEATVLDLIINGSDRDDDGNHFDFLVDSVEMVENNWRAAADMRIEQHRKRDAQLNFVDQAGQPVEELNVEVQQLNHDFGFGSTLNDGFMTNSVYTDFFKKHFERATIEWYSQWPAVESVRGTEDYTIADASVEFAQSNGIPIKGHALVYPSTTFLPQWLQTLSPSEVQAELEERITNVATRYQSQLSGWDVSNEMLNNDWLAEQLGLSVRPFMFQLAEQIDPQAVLSTNEFGLVSSQYKSRRYRELIEGLVADGANVGTIGLQSHHFDGYVSPKSLEIAIAELDDLGIDLYFTEFDLVHVDPEKRAEGLEDFYRYAFSVPQAKGITMWGFWAGAHWLGADAALVDLDWTVNAAGQKYLELIEEWTTSFEENSAGTNVTYRGFCGDYLVSTTDPETSIINHHLFGLAPGTDVLVADLKVNQVDGSLTVYGTSGDDLFEYDLQFPNRFVINGKVVLLDLPVEPTVIRFVGRTGVDRIEMKSDLKNQNIRITDKKFQVVGEQIDIQFEELESAHVHAKTLGSMAQFFDSRGDDSFSSYHEVSTMVTPAMALSAENFRYVFCRKLRGGVDSAWLYDTPGIDRLYADSRVVSFRWGSRNRRVIGFENVNVYSTEGSDIAHIDLPSSDNNIEVSPSSFSNQHAGKSLELVDFSRLTLNGAAGNDDVVSFSGSDSNETYRIYADLIYFTAPGFIAKVNDVNKSNYLTQSPGFDRVVINDTPADDQLEVTDGVVRYSNDSAEHILTGVDAIRANSTSGGSDSANVIASAPDTLLIGSWQVPN